MRQDSENLNEFLHSLSPNEMRVAIDKICSELEIPRYTIHNWMRGRSSMQPSHMTKIENLFHKRIFKSKQTVKNDIN